MDVLMPQLGETVAEGKIIKWFKSAGEEVKPGDNLFEIETDKVSMEVPSTTTGVLAEIRVPAGAVAPVGAVVGIIADGAGTTASVPTAAPPRQSADIVIPRDTGAAAIAAEARSPVALDPFFELRTPERNYGPARPSRLWRGAWRAKPESICRSSAARGRAAAASHETSRKHRGPSGDQLLFLPPNRRPPQSKRCLSPEASRKFRSTACAARLPHD